MSIIQPKPVVIASPKFSIISITGFKLGKNSSTVSFKAVQKLCPSFNLLLKLSSIGIAIFNNSFTLLNKGSTILVTMLLVTSCKVDIKPLKVLLCASIAPSVLLAILLIASLYISAVILPSPAIFLTSATVTPITSASPL